MKKIPEGVVDGEITANEGDGADNSGLVECGHCGNLVPRVCLMTSNSGVRACSECNDLLSDGDDY